jgi:uncharacterized protein (TIRG00374 family)
MENAGKKIIGVVVLAALLGLAVWYVGRNWASFAELKFVNAWLIVLLVVFFAVNLFFTSMINLELLKPLGVRIRQGESFGLSVVTGFYNLITPFRGGMAARAVYLKKKYDFAYVHFLATLSAVYVLVFMVSASLGLISTWWIYHATGMFSLVIFLIFLVVFVGVMGIAFFSPKFPGARNRWVNRFVKVINGWHLIKRNKRVIVVTLVVTLIQTLLSALTTMLSFRVFGWNVGFVECIFLSAISGIGLLIAITPGSLGISEAIMVFSAMTIGIDATQSLAVAILARLVSVVVLFVLGPIYSYVLLRGENEKKVKKRVK